jgi:hypothetical protein
VGVRWYWSDENHHQGSTQARYAAAGSGQVTTIGYTTSHQVNDWSKSISVLHVFFSFARWGDIHHHLALLYIH